MNPIRIFDRAARKAELIKSRGAAGAEFENSCDPQSAEPPSALEKEWERLIEEMETFFSHARDRGAIQSYEHNCVIPPGIPRKGSEFLVRGVEYEERLQRPNGSKRLPEKEFIIQLRGWEKGGPIDTPEAHFSIRMTGNGQDAKEVFAKFSSAHAEEFRRTDPFSQKDHYVTPDFHTAKIPPGYMQLVADILTQSADIFEGIQSDRIARRRPSQQAGAPQVTFF